MDQVTALESIKKGGPVAVTAYAIEDKYAGSIIGDRARDYDALEVHGVRDQNGPGDLEGTNFEIDDETPQLFSVYVHLVEGGVDCVGDFSKHSAAVNYAAELSAAYGWAVTDFSRASEVEMEENDQSYGEAEKIAAEKGHHRHFNGTATDQCFEGTVMGVTAAHIVLSLGRSAVILNQGDLSRVPEKDEYAVIAFKGGKGMVTELAKAAEMRVGR